MAKLKIIVSPTSFFCTRIEWALKLKGLEYELTFEDWSKGKSELLLRSNPAHKKVPVLLDDGVVIAESKVILEYIDEKWKGGDLYPLLPQDPYERAQARFWAQFADDKCFIGTWGACRAEDAQEKEKAVEAALESFTFLEKQIKGKKFFAGDKIGYLDLVAGWISHWLGVLEEAGGLKILDAERFPSLHEWAQNFAEIPPIKECLPPRDMLVNYWTALLSRLRSSAPSKL
ncbi:glutathione transferase GST 23-like [Rhodamnia argentea]|uniref:glutathione transferase n=1 Tax=Rhodamnia argentea TaxID=178133 RepID=A0ABM3HNI3_9MYRT|nr:glutathione transferase GST 23-like [Rhodamnia argentea]